MGRTIAIANQKGGVGKTTTAINLGASLAAAEARTLVVDLDPQANSTSGLGLDKNRRQPSVYDVLIGRREAEESIRATELETLFLLPSDQNLTGATLELLNEPDRPYRLRRALKPLQDSFAFILIDAPPSLGILTVNALTAADSLLIPIQCEYFALEGLSELLGTLSRVRQSFNPHLQIEGVLLTMYDERLNLANQIRANVAQHLGSQLLQTIIPRNVRLAESPSHGKPALLYDIRSPGANSYLRLAREILDHTPLAMRREAS